MGIAYHMKIAILNTFAPFIYGGAEYLADCLYQKLKIQGYSVNIIRIPFSWDPSQKIVESMLSAKLLHLANTSKVIALKFPAYLVPHENKVLWLSHQFRQAYDLWGTTYQGIPNSVAGQQIRQMIINQDNTLFTQTKKIFTTSDIVTHRLKKYNNIDAEPLYPPLLEPEKFYCDQFDNYLFYPSRINHGKRQHLATLAMHYTKTPIKLVIAGHPNHPKDLELLQETIEKYGLHDKVILLASRIAEQKKIDLMANCLGCVFIPFDEDYGYVTLEAFSAKKTVITCQDSGGVLSFVKQNETGLIAKPDPQELAHYFDHLYQNKHKARQLGEAGYERLKEMNLNWNYILRKLLQ